MPGGAGEATHIVSDGDELSVSYLDVGREATGRLIQTGGAVSASDYLTVGRALGVSGEYIISAGSLESYGLDVGFYGTGVFKQTGGTVTIATGGSFRVAATASSEGTYEFTDGTLLVPTPLVVGRGGGSGEFIQRGGLCDAWSVTIYDSTYELHGGELQVSRSVDIDGGLFQHIGGTCSLGHDLAIRGAPSTLEMYYGQLTVEESLSVSDGGTLDLRDGTIIADELVLDPGCVVLSGDGRPTLRVNAIRKTGGPLEFEMSGVLQVGSAIGTGSGSVTLATGDSLSVDNLSVSHDAPGQIVQDGGTTTVSESLLLGQATGMIGSYELGGSGVLSAGWEEIGSGGIGTFIQTAGTNTVSSRLDVGSSSTGDYTLSGTGVLSASTVNLGGDGIGTFTQTGGSCTVNDLNVDSNGTYMISGGTLDAGWIMVGYESGAGTVNITGASAEITSGGMVFGPDGEFAAVPTSTVHITGSGFGVLNTDSEAVAGLANLTLVFEGGTEEWQGYEVAGVDLGAISEGFESNFALGTLQVGGAEIALVRLSDLGDNQPGWTGTEALYLDQLILGAGATLDLNGINVYYHTFADEGGTLILNGGSLNPVDSGPVSGDLNCDGSIDAEDVSPFVLALLDPTAYEAAFPECDLMLADCYTDAVVNGLDVQAFIALLLGD